MWRPSLWFHSRSNQICLKPVFQIFSEQYRQRCFQTVPVVYNFYCWTKDCSIFISFFLFVLSLWIVGRSSGSIKSDFEMEEQQYEEKGKWYFSLVYIFYCSIKSWNPYEWICEKKNCTFVFFLQEWMYSRACSKDYHGGRHKVFMIHQAEDDAEPAICTQ